MKHYIYKILNLETDEFYIGVRSCRCEIEHDPYMGSSQFWDKTYIKLNKSILKKEILEVLESREIANIREIANLKKFENNPLCVNILYDKIPNHLGEKQSEEHINKRKMFGEKNGMYGKHHTEETKQKISNKLKGRIVSEEAKQKIGKAHKNKIVSEETRKKLSKSKSKLRKIVDLKTGKIFITTIPEFCNDKPELNPNSMKKAANVGSIYYKRYTIENIENNAAFIGNDNRKLGEYGETLEVDNPVGSLGSVK